MGFGLLLRLHGLLQQLLLCWAAAVRTCTPRLGRSTRPLLISCGTTRATCNMCDTATIISSDLSAPPNTNFCTAQAIIWWTLCKLSARLTLTTSCTTLLLAVLECPPCTRLTVSMGIAKPTPALVPVGVKIAVFCKQTTFTAAKGHSAGPTASCSCHTAALRVVQQRHALTSQKAQEIAPY